MKLFVLCLALSSTFAHTTYANELEFDSIFELQATNPTLDERLESIEPKAARGPKLIDCSSRPIKPVFVSKRRFMREQQNSIVKMLRNLAGEAALTEVLQVLPDAWVIEHQDIVADDFGRLKRLNLRNKECEGFLEHLFKQFKLHSSYKGSVARRFYRFMHSLKHIQIKQVHWRQGQLTIAKYYTIYQLNPDITPSSFLNKLKRIHIFDVNRKAILAGSYNEGLNYEKDGLGRKIGTYWRRSAEQESVLLIRDFVAGFLWN